MKLAYGLQLHNNPAQFERLFSAIYNPGDVFAIHVDSKTSDATYAAFTKIVGSRDNVHWVPRMRVYWGCWQIVLLQLRLMTSLLSIDRSWTHFINLSGSCMPLRSRDEIVERLRAAPERPLVDLSDRVSDYHDRIAWSHRATERGPVRTAVPKAPPVGFDVEFIGESWHVLPRKFCEWMESSPRAAEILDFFPDVGWPDEMYVQCLVCHSPWRHDVGPVAWEIVWLPEAYNPEILTISDRDRLFASDALFARKFDCSVDDEIVRLVEARARPDGA